MVPRVRARRSVTAVSVMSRPEVKPPQTALDRLQLLIPAGLAFGAVRLRRADRLGQRDDLATVVLTLAVAGAVAVAGRDALRRQRSRADTQELARDLEAQAAVERGRAAFAEGDFANAEEMRVLRDQLRARAS